MQQPDADRRLRQADRLARFLRVLRLIEGAGRWNADQIAAELSVSRRTVMRDLKVLELAGVPYYYDRNRKCFELRYDYELKAPRLTRDEIASQTLATAFVRAVGVDPNGSALSATSKIASAASEEDKLLFADACEILTALSLQFVDHAGHEETIQTIQQALFSQRYLLGTYRSPYQKDSVQLTLSPLRLCLLKQALYLIAVPIGAAEPKTYRIARFESIELNDKPALTLPDFDLQAYLGNAWAVFRGDETYEVSVRFGSLAAKIVTETVWHRTQRVEASHDETVVLHFTVDGLEEILEWLLTWTGHAEVLAPKKLRTLLVQRLRAGLELNE